MTPVGATVVGSVGHFEVWAPDAATADLILVDDDRTIPMHGPASDGRWRVDVDRIGHGARYRFRLNGGEALADPASQWQPDGVHGASAVVDPTRFRWGDHGWSGVELADAVYYELHVGTFTPVGTLDGAIEQLDRLAALGVTLIELMPVSPTPGRRNWGYDGVFPNAVDEAYGGPDALARFVDAAHRHGLGVVLDVVCNHLGPEGNVLARFGPYFVDTIRTPWGDALNVAGADSDEVRGLFIQGACQWVEHFHIDGFRLDAVDFIVDQTARPFLEEFTTAVHAVNQRCGRRVLVVAESASNDPRLVRSVDGGGIGLDGMWNDDLHHALAVALSGDRRGYYVDYDGVGDLATVFERRWVFDGRYSAFRRRRHGRSADHVDHRQLIVCSSNHDQIGNTPDGRRPDRSRAQRVLATSTPTLPHFPSSSTMATPTSWLPPAPGEPPSSPTPVGIAPSPIRPRSRPFRPPCSTRISRGGHRIASCWPRRPRCCGCGAPTQCCPTPRRRKP
jgi:maltooligosyltrehalose trehalohydrolase